MSGVLKLEITAIAMKEGVPPGRLLGIFSGAYFYTYALAQIFVGPIIDSLGVRKAGSTFLLLLAAGTLIMSIPETSFLISGRLLVGFAASVAYLSYHRATSHYFSKDKQGTLTAVAIIVGSLGSLISTYPFRLMLTRLGFTPTLAIFSIMTAAIALLLLGTDIRDVRGKFRDNLKLTLTGVRKVLGDPHIYGIGAAGITSYGVVVSFQSSWGQMFYESLGLSVSSVSRHLLVIPLVSIPLSLIAGYVSDNVLRKRKPILQASCLFSTASWAILLTAYKHNSYSLASLGAIALGITLGLHVVMAASAKENYSPAISASTIAIMNVMTFAGISLFNTISPLIGVERTLMLTLAVAALGSLLMSVLTRETLGQGGDR